MSELLYCCPRCSLMPPAGTNLTPMQHHGAFFEPRIHVGTRSKKCWLHRRTGCDHRPELAGPMATADEISTPWNDWVRTEALVVYAERKLPADRLDLWLAWLGIPK